MKESMSQTIPATSIKTGTMDAQKSLKAATKTEMTVFQNSGVRGRCLQLAYTYLLPIPSTSVEAERAFSAAGLMCTKIRFRLADNRAYV